MEYLSPAQAAERLGLSLSRIHQLVQTGRFPGAYHTNPQNRRRGEWKIPVPAVEAFERQPPGRPVKA